MTLRKRIDELIQQGAEQGITGSNVVRSTQSANSGVTIGQAISDPDSDGNVQVRLATGETVTAIMSSQQVSKGDVVSVVGNLLL